MTNLPDGSALLQEFLGSGGTLQMVPERDRTTAGGDRACVRRNMNSWLVHLFCTYVNSPRAGSILDTPSRLDTEHSFVFGILARHAYTWLDFVLGGKEIGLVGGGKC